MTSITIRTMENKWSLSKEEPSIYPTGLMTESRRKMKKVD